MNADKLIIDSPRLVRPGQKLTAWGVTLLFWGMLLYLWQPLISLLAWGLNIRLFYSHMIILGGYQAFVDLLAFYGLVILCLSGALLVWARVQQWRFRGVERRQQRAVVPLDEMASRFAVEAGELQVARTARRLRVRLAADGRVAELERLSDPVSKSLTTGQGAPSE